MYTVVTHVLDYYNGRSYPHERMKIITTTNVITSVITRMRNHYLVKYYKMKRKGSWTLNHIIIEIFRWKNFSG